MRNLGPRPGGVIASESQPYRACSFIGLAFTAGPLPANQQTRISNSAAAPCRVSLLRASGNVSDLRQCRAVARPAIPPRPEGRGFSRSLRWQHDGISRLARSV